MRLLQMLSGAPHGGAETFFVTLNQALQRRADRYGLVQRQIIRPVPGRVEQLRASGCDVQTARFGGKLDLYSSWRLDRLIRDFDPEVVLAWMSRAASYLPRRRSYLTIGRLGGYYKLKNFRNCDHLILNTPELYDYVTRLGWPARRAHVIPNFTTVTPAPPVPRASFDTPEGVPLVLALGRLHRVKGFDLLIQALADLPEVWLWIAGEGGERPALEAQIAGLGLGHRVRLLGWQEARAGLLAAADLCVVSSRQEPLGNVILEAWATGTPVLATKVAGPQWLIADGVQGLLVERDTAAALSDGIRRVLADRDQARSWAAAGREKLQAQFSEEVVVDQYMTLLGALLRPIV